MINDYVIWCQIVRRYSILLAFLSIISQMTNAIWVIQYLLTMILDYVSTSWKNKRVLQIKVVYDFLQQIRIVGSERLVK